MGSWRDEVIIIVHSAADTTSTLYSTPIDGFWIWDSLCAYTRTFLSSHIRSGESLLF